MMSLRPSLATASVWEAAVLRPPLATANVMGCRCPVPQQQVPNMRYQAPVTDVDLNEGLRQSGYTEDLTTEDIEVLREFEYDFTEPSNSENNRSVFKSMDTTKFDVLMLARRADRHFGTAQPDGGQFAWSPVDDGAPHSGNRCLYQDMTGFKTMTEHRSVAFIEDELRRAYSDYDTGGYSIHFRTVRSHKWHVLMIFNFLESRVPLDVSRWDIIRHDESKFSYAEVQGYVDRWVWGAQTDRWKSAVAHHYANNTHHPEYWIDADGVVKRMPNSAVDHAIIDRLAVGWERVFQSKPTLLKELVANARKFPIRGHSESVEYFDKKLDEIASLDASVHVVKLSCKCLQYHTDPCDLHG